MYLYLQSRLALINNWNLDPYMDNFFNDNDTVVFFDFPEACEQNLWQQNCGRYGTKKRILKNFKAK